MTEPQLIREDGGVWNDDTWSWEIIGETRVAKAYALVQQRKRSREFSREYVDYVSDLERRNVPRLPADSGGDSPADDPPDNVRAGLS